MYVTMGESSLREHDRTRVQKKSERVAKTNVTTLKGYDIRINDDTEWFVEDPGDTLEEPPESISIYMTSEDPIEVIPLLQHFGLKECLPRVQQRVPLTRRNKSRSYQIIAITRRSADCRGSIAKI